MEFNFSGICPNFSRDLFFEDSIFCPSLDLAVVQRFVNAWPRELADGRQLQRDPGKRARTLLIDLVSTVNSCSTFHCWWNTNEISWTGIQEQIAASHEFDGVRKEKERLTAASLKTLACLVHNDAKVLDAAHKIWSPSTKTYPILIYYRRSYLETSGSHFRAPAAD